MYAFNDKLVVYDAKPEDGLVDGSDRFHIKNARLSGDQYINSAITYLGGNGGAYGSQNYPILMKTLAMGNKVGISSVDNTYKIRMIGKPKITTTISQIVTQSNPGLNGALFKIRVADRIFESNEEIISGGLNSITLKVQDDGKVISKGVVEYGVKRAGAFAHLGVPASFLVYGAKWANGLIKVSQEDSHGTKQRTYQTPFELQNQLSTFRKSYTYKGNVKNKKLVVPIEVDGQVLKLWSDWDYFNQELQFNVDRNDDLLFSELNLDANNIVSDLDVKSGNESRSGMGLWDMITNTVEFAELTRKKLDDPIQDIFSSVGSAYNLTGDYTLIGGLGFLKDFDRLVSETARGFLTLIGEKFYMREGENGMQYGNYFTEYKHISGKTIKVAHDGAFDRGKRSQTSGKHPVSGLSIMSHCAVALDWSLVDNKQYGQMSNIAITYEEGREFVETVINGMNSGQKVVSTDIDRTSTHKMATQGVYLNNPSSCCKYICKVNPV